MHKCHLIINYMMFLPITDERTSKAHQLLGMVCLLWYYMHDSQQNRSATVGTRDNMPYWRHLLVPQRANLLSYKCITTLWIEKRSREKGKRVARQELKARCHIIIVLWRARASRSSDDKNGCRHAELSFTLHHEDRLLMCKAEQRKLQTSMWSM